MSGFPLPLLGFSAYSGTGKTTLLSKLIPVLNARGLRVGVVKHAHHQFDIDRPGKDSHTLREAGAEQIVIASGRRLAFIQERREPHEPRLPEALAVIDSASLDLVLVEGFKREAFAKIELHRPSLGNPLLCIGDKNIIAIASDAPLAGQIPAIPQLDINDIQAIGDFIMQNIIAKRGVQRKTGGA